MFRPSRAVVAALALAAACNDSNGINGNFVHTINFALVKFVNATDTPIAVANNGVLATATAGIVFGRQTTCLAVDLSNTSVGLTFTNAVTGTTFTVFTTPLVIGVSVAVIAFVDGNGVVQFAVIGNEFTPTTGNAGIRFFNATAGVGALTMRANGVAISAPTPLGSASAFTNIAPTPHTITFVNDSATVLNAGTLTFAAGQSSTLVVGPAAGASGLRFFTTTGC
jgi:uncharacterized protein DUF4397